MPDPILIDQLRSITTAVQAVDQKGAELATDVALLDQWRDGAAGQLADYEGRLRALEKAQTRHTMAIGLVATVAGSLLSRIWSAAGVLQ